MLASELLGAVLPVLPGVAPRRYAGAFVEYHRAASHKKPRKRKRRPEVL
jgi:hypothetical protein